MTIAWVEADTPLPDPHRAPPGGLVAAGRDLSAARLDEAYRKGLFPWFSPGDPVLWWSPDPRMVLRCEDLHISQSLAKRLRQFGRAPDSPRAPLRVTLNLAFEAVIAQCARRAIPRIGIGAARAGLDWPAARPASGRDATWITPEIIAAYTDWHHQGQVHSVETWIDDRLVGGLYGVGLGRCFFGETMFSHVADASKIALACLVRYLQAQAVPWVDCQQETPHLSRLGARPIARAQFLNELAVQLRLPAPAWGRGRLLPDGTLLPLD